MTGPCTREGCTRPGLWHGSPEQAEAWARARRARAAAGNPQAIRAAISARQRLAGERRALYARLIGEGKSIEEAAAEVGVTAKTARQRYEPARRAASGDGEP